MASYSKTELNREHLLSQGVNLFGQYGFNGIGLKDILASVKVPKGSFYHYFESKEDYGSKVIEYYTEHSIQMLQGSLNNPQHSGFEAVRQTFANMIQMHRDDNYLHGCLVGSLGAEVSSSSELCRSSLSLAMAQFREVFVSAIERGQEDGSIRSDIEALSLSDVLLNSFEGALLRMKIEKTYQPLEQFLGLLLDKFLAAT